MTSPVDPENGERPSLPGRPPRQNISSALNSETTVAGGSPSGKTADVAEDDPYVEIEPEHYRALLAVEEAYVDEPFDVEAEWQSLQERLEGAPPEQRHRTEHAFYDLLTDDEYREFRRQRLAEDNDGVVPEFARAVVVTLPEKTLPPEVLDQLREPLRREAQRHLDKAAELNAPGRKNWRYPNALALAAPLALVHGVIYDALEQLSGGAPIEPSEAERFELVEVVAPWLFDDPSAVFDQQHAQLRREAEEAWWQALAEESGIVPEPDPFDIPTTAAPAEALVISVAKFLDWNDGERHEEPVEGSDPVGVVRNVVEWAVADIPNVAAVEIAALLRTAPGMIYETPPEIVDSDIWRLVREIEQHQGTLQRQQATEYVTVADWFASLTPAEAEALPDRREPGELTPDQEAIRDNLPEKLRSQFDRQLGDKLVTEALAAFDAAATPAGPHRTFALSDLEEMPDAEWLIEGFIPAAGVGQLIAESGIGKTYMWLAIAEAIASGDADIAGHSLNNDRRKVLYLAYESESALRNRVKAIAKHRARPFPEDDLRFWLSSESERPLALDSDSGVRELRVTLDASGFTPENAGLIIIDTQALALPTTDENSNDDWNQMIGRLKRLAADYGAAIVLVGHPGHDGSRARGASSQRQSLDFTLSVKGKQMRLDKSRRSEGNRAMFGIEWAEGIEVGTERSGAPITERVFAPTEPKPPTVAELHDAAFEAEQQVPELLEQHREEHGSYPSNKDETARFIAGQLKITKGAAKQALTEASNAGLVEFDRSSPTSDRGWRPVNRP